MEGRVRIIRARREHRLDIDRLIRRSGIATHLDVPIRNCFVAMSGSRIIGCAALQWYGTDVAILTHCVVERDFRHRGIGTELVRRRLHQARLSGKRTAALCTMYYQFRHYKKLGFRTCPRAKLPENVRTYRQFNAQRYMKCAVMVRFLR